MLRAVLFLTLCALVAADYYDVLGVSRDATPSMIKRGFRRKARQLHPDKNKDDPEAEKKYQELNEAYQVLSDAEKRRQYDQLGHARFTQSEKGGGGGGFRQQGSFNFEDLFGGGGFGGGGFEQFFNFGGGGGFGGGQRQARRGRLFTEPDSAVVRLSQEEHQEQVLGSLRAWFVMYYSESCSHCHQAAPALSRVAAKLKNIIRVGAVDCERTPHACSGVDAYPTFVLYSGDEEHVPRALSDGIEYNGPRQDAAMLRFCVNNVPSNVDALSTFEAFEAAVIKQGEYLQVPTVILVSAKKQASPLYAAISRDFAESFDFVFVSTAKKSASNRKLLEHLDVAPDAELPVFMIRNYVIKGARDQRWGDKGDQKLGYERMSEILTSYSAAMEQLKKAGGRKRRSYESTSVAFMGLSNMDEVCPPRGGVLCVLSLAGEGPEPPMEKLAERFLKDRFKFARVDDETSADFKTGLGLVEKRPLLVVWNAKRSRAAVYTGDDEFAGARLFLDGILGGSGSWMSLDLGADAGETEE